MEKTNETITHDPPRIVTLMTDFGWRDYSHALLKGELLTANPNVNIIDISHEVGNYDIVQAAYLFRNVWKSFPDKTIHLISVDDCNNDLDYVLFFEYDGHYFVGPDNGVFSLIFGERPAHLYRWEITKGNSKKWLVAYANLVGMLASGAKIDSLGEETDQMIERINLQPVVMQSQMRGTIIYIDKFGNAVSNITREIFEKAANGRNFELYYKRKEPVYQLSQTFSDVEVGSVLCLFNAAGYLQVSINKDNAAGLLGLEIEHTIQIEFKG